MSDGRPDNPAAVAPSGGPAPLPGLDAHRVSVDNGNDGVSRPSGPTLAVTVFGTPQPGGSKKAFVNPRTKQANVVDANPKAKPWQTIIAQVVGEAMEVATLALLPGPLAVEFDFYRARPAGHFGTGRNAGQLKGSAPPWPTTRPDVLKLARAVEDALTGVTWRDDAEIVVERLRKHYGEPERVEIRVWAGEAFEEYLA